MAGIAGSCAVRDEALTQNFHLAQCKALLCACVFVFMCTSGGRKTITRLFVGPFSLQCDGYEFASIQYSA